MKLNSVWNVEFVGAKVEGHILTAVLQSANFSFPSNNMPMTSQS
jgi:hypothetical protein